MKAPFRRPQPKTVDDRVHHHEADVVPMTGVLPPGISQAYQEQHEGLFLVRVGILGTGALALAHAAAALIRDHNRIIIDSGRTTAALLPELSNKNGLVVMTNSLSIANALRELENEPTLLMTGGTWDPHSEAFQGQLAEQVLRAYDFDQLFIGADGIDLDRGTTTFNELYSLSRVMAEVAREVVVMAESDKFGRKIHNLELPWDMVDVLVTDAALTQEAKATIESHGVRVVCAAS